MKNSHQPFHSLFFSFNYLSLATLYYLRYVPALALSQVSGINLHIITTFTSIVCIFYTTFGGLKVLNFSVYFSLDVTNFFYLLKAVVYTDALQLIMMIGGIVCVMCLGLKDTGGLENVLKVADDGGRLIFFK